MPNYNYLSQYNDLEWTHTVTITHLLSHTSGICSGKNGRVKIKDFKTEKIGSFQYANENYKIAAKILTTITKRSLSLLYYDLFLIMNQ